MGLRHGGPCRAFTLAGEQGVSVGSFLIPRSVWQVNGIGARMAKAQQPDVVFIPRGITPDAVRAWAASSGLALAADPKPGLLLVYPDRRVLPKVCARTGMRRAGCCCSPCRVLRRRKHRAHCGCSLCYADRMGAYIDRLGRHTAAGRWLWFVTLTYRTRAYPWGRGFPVGGTRPHPDFVHGFFERMIRWIEGQVHTRVEYFVADQLGERGGRLHQHCGLSWPGLFEYRWKHLQQMLWKNAGFTRILPWKKHAAHYIGRFIDRDAETYQWGFRVGPEPVRSPVKVGRVVVAPSAPLPSSEFRKILRRRHR